MNFIIIKGRLTKDPELSVSNGGKEYLRFGVAVTDNFDRDKTHFFDCIAFGKTAGFIATYFSRGQEILISGDMRQDRYTDKDGNNRISWSMGVNRVEFCGSKSQNNTANNNDLPYVPDDEDKPW